MNLISAQSMVWVRGYVSSDNQALISTNTYYYAYYLNTIQPKFHV